MVLLIAAGVGFVLSALTLWYVLVSYKRQPVFLPKPSELVLEMEKRASGSIPVIRVLEPEVDNTVKTQAISWESTPTLELTPLPIFANLDDVPTQKIPLSEDSGEF